MESKMDKIKKIMLFTVPLIALAGCSDEKEQQRLTIQNYEIIDTYEYDKVKVVVEEEKTPEELAYDVIMETMGLTASGQVGYKEVGIDEDNGVFINGGILEGDKIPKVSGYSSADAVDINSGSEQSETVKLEQFKELQKNREYKVSVYDEDEVLKETAERIEQASLEQEIRRQEQMEKSQHQQSGEAEFNIETVEPEQESVPEDTTLEEPDSEDRSTESRGEVDY